MRTFEHALPCRVSFSYVAKIVIKQATIRISASHDLIKFEIHFCTSLNIKVVCMVRKHKYTKYLCFGLEYSTCQVLTIYTPPSKLHQT